MNKLPERFDVFCKDIIEKCRIDIDHIPFEDETDKEVFIIRHLVIVMHKLYNGIQQYKTEYADEQELKSIATYHLRQYTSQLYQNTGSK